MHSTIKSPADSCTAHLVEVVLLCLQNQDAPCPHSPCFERSQQPGKARGPYFSTSGEVEVLLWFTFSVAHSHQSQFYLNNQLTWFNVILNVTPPSQHGSYRAIKLHDVYKVRASLSITPLNAIIRTIPKIR